MTPSLKQRLLDQLAGIIIGSLVTGSLSIFVVVRKLDRLETAIAERHIAQLARDSEQDRRLNNVESMLYTSHKGDR